MKKISARPSGPLQDLFSLVRVTNEYKLIQCNNMEHTCLMSIEQEVQGVCLPHLTYCIRFCSFVASLSSVAAFLCLQTEPTFRLNERIYLYLYTSRRHDFHFQLHEKISLQRNVCNIPSRSSLVTTTTTSVMVTVMITVRTTATATATTMEMTTMEMTTTLLTSFQSR